MEPIRPNAAADVFDVSAAVTSLAGIFAIMNPRRRALMAWVIPASVILAVGCSSSGGDSPSTSPGVPSTPQATTSATVAGPSVTVASPSTVSAGLVVESALETAGATCTPSGKTDESDCTLHDTAFTLSTAGWDETSDLRGQACTQGHINETYLVLTDRSEWTITTDDNTDYVKIENALRANGISAVALAPYCP